MKFSIKIFSTKNFFTLRVFTQLNISKKSTSLHQVKSSLQFKKQVQIVHGIGNPGGIGSILEIIRFNKYTILNIFNL